MEFVTVYTSVWNTRCHLISLRCSKFIFRVTNGSTSKHIYDSDCLSLVTIFLFVKRSNVVPYMAPVRWTYTLCHIGSYWPLNSEAEYSSNKNNGANDRSAESDLDSRAETWIANPFKNINILKLNKTKTFFSKKYFCLKNNVANTRNAPIPSFIPFNPF